MSVEEDTVNARLEQVERRLAVLEGNDEQFDDRVRTASSQPDALGNEPTDDSGADDDFHPEEHTVPEVNEHLADASEDERRRVLDAEREGEARSGILQGPHAQ